MFSFFKKVIKKHSKTENKDCTKQSKQNLCDDSSSFLVQILKSWSSFNSSMVFLGLSCETYLFGAKLAGNIIAVILGYLIALVFIQPFIYELEEKINTPYKYLEKRYINRKLTRAVVSFAGNAFNFTLMALHSYSAALLLNLLFNKVPIWGFVIIFNFISIFGSIFDGYKQYLWIELVQLFSVFIIILIAILLTFYGNETFTTKELWNIAEIGGRTRFIDLRADLKIKYSLWNQIFSLPLPWATLHALTAPNFKKLKIINTDLKSKLLLLVNIPIMVFTNMMFIMAGILTFIFYHDCDPLLHKDLRDRNQIAPNWILNVQSRLVPFLTGILFSSLVCNCLIMHSVGITQCSNAIFKDFLNPIFVYIKINLKSMKIVDYFLKINLNLCNILCAFIFRFVKNSLISLFFLISNSINPCILGIILLSIYNTYANRFGAIISFIIALIICVWLAIGRLLFLRISTPEFVPTTVGCIQQNTTLIIQNNSTNHNKTLPKTGYVFSIYSISSLWYPFLSFWFIMIFGTIFSLIYALIKRKKLDSDSQDKIIRNKYLFFKMRSD